MVKEWEESKGWFAKRYTERRNIGYTAPEQYIDMNVCDKCSEVELQDVMRLVEEEQERGDREP